MTKGTLYGPIEFYKSQRIQIIANYSGKNIEMCNKPAPDNLCVPKGAVPVYCEGDVTLFETNAIGFYLANEEMKGGEHKAEVSQWCNYADLVLLPAVGTMVFPCLGLVQLNKSDNEKARALLVEELTFLNQVLLKKTYLVGERITQADITVFSVLKMLFEMIFDESSRKSMINVVRWFNTVANQEKVKGVVGEMKWCVTPAQFDAKKYAELHPKKDKEPKEEKKPQEKKPKEKKPEKKAKEVEEEEMDLDTPAVPQGPCPYSLLPKGTFDMDEWKRTYSNNDIESVALPYFWDKFDAENYSIWTCEYLFPDELELIFMTCNLVSGMFQRLDRLRKHAFASMVVLGQNHKNQIKGLWVLKGQELAFTLHEDCRVDYESYKWTKLDPAADSTKEMVKNYFTHTGDFGMAFNQGKIFK